MKNVPVWLEPLLLLLGGCLVVAGVAMVYAPAAVVVAGVLLVGVGWPKGGAA